MQQELWAIFSLLRESITFSKICLFDLLLLNGITPILETLRLFQSLRKKKIQKVSPPSSFIDCPNPKGIKRITRFESV